MKRSILILLLVVAVVTVSVAASSQARKADTAKDPVCGITVVKNPQLSTSYKGETYYFCSNADLETFRKNPEKYAGKR